MNRILKPGAFAEAEHAASSVAPPPLAPVKTLSKETLAALHLSFSKLQHFPTEEMWEALKAIAETLEAMANGTCEELIHLASLDPGIGKTTTVIHFLKALLSSKRHEGVAAIVCAKRRDQIQDMVEDAGLSRGDFAILTADETLNALGSSPKKARVLLTTHSMVEKRTAGRRFADVAAFHYRGVPRTVRVWDEAMLPGLPLTVPRDTLAGLLKPMRGHHPALTDALEALFAGLRDFQDRDQAHLPDLAEEHGVALNDALRVVQGGPQDLVSAFEALWFLFGKCVTVRSGGCPEGLLKYARQASLVEQPTLPGLGLQCWR